MRASLLILPAVSVLMAPAQAPAGASPSTPAGTYDIIICAAACSLDTPEKVLVRGSLVLFAKPLAESDLQRFDQNRFRHHSRDEAINGCFTLQTLRRAAIHAGVERIGVTSWSEQGGRFHFSLMHSPDAGYAVSVERTGTDLTGTGSSWGVGAAAPAHHSEEAIVARRRGDADISRCTLQSAEERESRRLLADPVREVVFAQETAYRTKLLEQLDRSPVPRDWAMAGWLQESAAGTAQILRARKAAPEDALIRWISVARIPVRSAQTSQADDSVLDELERSEPKNAAVWTLALRDATADEDEAATDTALARLSASTLYDDHAADILEAQISVFQQHPLAAEFFTTVARLDPGWRLNGAFTAEIAPYYENQYPFAAIGSSNLFRMPTQPGINPLFAACTGQSGPRAARNVACLAAARVIAATARRADVRRAGSMLLSEMDVVDADDVTLARNQAWIAEQYDEFYPRNGERPSVARDVAFVRDWMESRDEFEAMRRAVARAHKPLQPPPEFTLNEHRYGNFVKARAASTPQRTP